MKKFLAIALLFLGYFAQAQNNQITKLLNDQLQKEYNQLYDAEEKVTFKIVEYFTINDGVLTFAYTTYNPYSEEVDTVICSVPLAKISQVGKDVNVFFSTSGTKDIILKQVSYDKEGNKIRENITTSDFMLTQINKEKNNENLRDKLIKAFKKAGYTITSEFWYD